MAHDDTSDLGPMETADCPQCDTAVSAPAVAQAAPASQESPAPNNMVSLAEFLAGRINRMKEELRRVEKQTGVMMNRLIREVDHSVARKLQRDIGRLDTHHAELNERIKRDATRYRRFVELL